MFFGLGCINQNSRKIIQCYIIEVISSMNSCICGYASGTVTNEIHQRKCIFNKIDKSNKGIIILSNTKKLLREDNGWAPFNDETGEYQPDKTLLGQLSKVIDSLFDGMVFKMHLCGMIDDHFIEIKKSFGDRNDIVDWDYDEERTLEDVVNLLDDAIENYYNKIIMLCNAGVAQR